MTSRTVFNVVKPHVFSPVSFATSALAIPATADAETLIALASSCVHAANGIAEQMQARDSQPIDGNETFAIRCMLGIASACYTALGVEP